MTRVPTTRLDELFHALSDATRRTILMELSERDEQTLFEICVRLIQVHRLSLTRQAISKHLAVLEDVRLIETQWKGRTKTHSCRLQEARRLIGEWLAQVDSLQK